MSIKASASVTLSSYRDTEAVTRYYKLVSSTASAPSKPTTNPPSGWDDTEPSYTSGSTNTLYFCDLTEFSDGTWAYSAVSKSSSYEAAKEAYNKAQNAQDTANSANGKIDDLEIGGRNLFLQTKTFGAPWSGTATPTVDTDGFWYSKLRNTWGSYIRQDLVLEDITYTISFYAKAESTVTLEIKDDSENNKYLTSIQINTTDWSKYSISIKPTILLSTPGIAFLTKQNTTDIYIKKIKLEIGNKATDWTPAPEDMVDKANIVSCINQTPESITIQANKISLEGLITANSNFKILNDGSIETISGKIGGWSIGNNKIYSENPLSVELNNKEGTSYVSLVSDNPNNNEVISVVYDYLEDGVADDRTSGTTYVKIFNDGRLKIGTEGIWADDIPAIDTTEISGSSITLTGSSQESFKCLITPEDINFVSSVRGDAISLMEFIGSRYETIVNYSDSYHHIVLKANSQLRRCYFMYYRKISVPNNTVVYTIPSGYRPAYNGNVCFNLCKHASSGMGTAQLSFGTDGKCVLGSIQYNENLYGGPFIFHYPY